jgi:hypothetical protein
MAEDAVRSKTVSARLFPAICDLQGDFQKLQREPVQWLSNFPMLSTVWREFSLLSEQRAFFRIAGKSSEGLRMVAGSVSQIPLRRSSAPQLRAADGARCAASEFRHLPVPETAYRLAGNKGRFWCTPSTVEIAGAKRSERKGHAGGDAAEQSHQIGGKDVLRGFPP